MAITFPLSPVDGDLFSTNGGRVVYIRTGDGWRSNSSAVSITAPDISASQLLAVSGDEKFNMILDDGSIVRAELDQIIGMPPVDSLLQTVAVTLPLAGDGTAGNPLGINAASQSDAGVVELANTVETRTGTDNTRAVTPANLMHPNNTKAHAESGITNLDDASVAQIAALTNADSIVMHTTGGDTFKIPASDFPLPANVVASQTAQGIVELATVGETLTGTDTSRAVTPAALFDNTVTQGLLGSGVSATNQASAGEIAAMTGANTDLLVRDGAGNVRLVGVSDVNTLITVDTDTTITGDGTVASPLGVVNATTAVRGIIEVASAAEVAGKTDSTRAITASSLFDNTVTSPLVSDGVEATTQASIAEVATMNGLGEEVFMRLNSGLYRRVLLTDFLDKIGVLYGAQVTAPLSGNGTAAFPLQIASATIADRGIVELATNGETQAGTDDTRVVTPASLASLTANGTRAGLVELATNGETQTGIDDTRAVTPASLASLTATIADRGLVELATNGETQAGTDDTRAVTPASLASLTATETRIGLVELATNMETQMGIDDTRAVTPVSLLSRTATDARVGLVELATNGETQTGTDDTRAVTPASLASLTATETRNGLVELATNGETQTGTDDTRAVTPASLASLTASDARNGLVELATDIETQAGTDATRAVTPASLASLTATETRIGLVELATNAQVQGLTNPSVVITPATLSSLNASTALRGIIQIATTSDVLSGTGTNTAVTPAALDTRIATTTRSGLVQQATTAEIGAGSTSTLGSSGAVLFMNPSNMYFTPNVASYDYSLDKIWIKDESAGTMGWINAHQIVPVASETQVGITLLASGTQVQNLTVANAAVTPSTLGMLTASTTQRGIMEIATTNETRNGTDATRAVSPNGLYNLPKMTNALQTGDSQDGLLIRDSSTNQMRWLDFEDLPSSGGGAVNSTGTVAGIVELATNAEITAGSATTDGTGGSGASVVLTPSRMYGAGTSNAAPDRTNDRVWFRDNSSGEMRWLRVSSLVPVASDTLAGISERATITETRDGTSTSRTISPNTLSNLPRMTNALQTGDDQDKLLIRDDSTGQMRWLDFEDMPAGSSNVSTSSALFPTGYHRSTNIDGAFGSAAMSYTIPNDGTVTHVVAHINVAGVGYAEAAFAVSPGDIVAMNGSGFTVNGVQGINPSGPTLVVGQYDTAAAYVRMDRVNQVGIAGTTGYFYPVGATS